MCGVLCVENITPKEKSSRSVLLKLWIQECGNSDYSSDRKVIFCQVNSMISNTKKSISQGPSDS